jgi:type III secretion protein U
MAEKTEKATPKKLRDARKKGQVAKSQDLPSAFTFLASVAAVIGMSGFLYSQMADIIRTCFQMVTSDNVGKMIPELYAKGIYIIFVTSMPILVMVVFIGVLINFMSVGPMFALEAMKPDIKKFDPIQNLKAKFKIKTLIELIKSLFKISVAAFLIYGVVYNSIPELIRLTGLPMEAALRVFYTFLMQVLVKVGLLFLVVAIADFVFQKKNFAKEMMMEKFEIKQEYKNTEGNPEIKGKRKQIAQEIAYQEGPAQAVQGAKAVVTNPTHLAIAIGYDKKYDAAPYIRYMAEGREAAMIIELAEKFDKPILRNIPLAHKLWDEGEINQYVPEQTFEVLANILQLVATWEEEGRPSNTDMEEQIQTD